MKNFKRSNLTTALLTIFLLAISTNQAQANMFNRFREGFYFEKYKTAEEAKAALLEMHPIGSSVESLIKTLEGAGCVIKKVDQQQLDLAKKTNSKYRKVDEIINCKAATGFLNWVEWRISVTVKNKKIDDIGIGKEYTGL